MTFSPFSFLNAVGALFSRPAVIIKKNGERLPVHICPESPTNFPTGYGGRVEYSTPLRVWSVSVVETSDDAGNIYTPSAGDALEIIDDQNVTRRYSVTANDAGAFWEWSYQREGYRYKFFTKYAEA